MGWLGLRIVGLERRVARLSERIGSSNSASAEPAPRAAGVATVQRTQADRVRSIEVQLNQLAANSANRGTSSAPRSPFEAENQILSVVEREKSRVRDVQLEFHRTRWLEGRNAQLDAFAKAQGLSQSQTAALRAQFEREVDDIVKVLNNPDFASDPDHSVNDWDAALAKTDEAAHSILDAHQAQLWDQVRVFEKRVLWPWLPKR